jgi:hypothetical protein
MNATLLTAKLAEPFIPQRQVEKARNKIVLYRQQEEVLLLKKTSRRIRDPYGFLKE